MFFHKYTNFIRRLKKEEIFIFQARVLNLPYGIYEKLQNASSISLKLSLVGQKIKNRDIR